MKKSWRNVVWSEREIKQQQNTMRMLFVLIKTVRQNKYPTQCLMSKWETNKKPPRQLEMNHYYYYRKLHTLAALNFNMPTI